MKRVYRAASLLQVAHARNVLITAGIRCEMRNQYLAGAMGDLPMMETWPQLYVEDEDEQYALSALSRAAAAAGRSPLDLRGMPGATRAAIHLLLEVRLRAGPRQRALRRSHAAFSTVRRRIGWRVHRMCHRRPLRPTSSIGDVSEGKIPCNINGLNIVSDKHRQTFAQSLSRGSACTHGDATLHRLQISPCSV